MLYNSTRDSGAAVSAAEAIARGISPEGGLYVPEAFPALSSPGSSPISRTRKSPRRWPARTPAEGSTMISPRLSWS